MTLLAVERTFSTVHGLMSKRDRWHLSSLFGVLFPKLVSGATWDREYANGAWDRLRSDSELGRYALIAGHVLQLPEHPALLDVGCGDGRLLELIARGRGARYLGVDVSAEAVQRARALAIADSSFEVASAESFQTEQQFDAIVFNEVLYYIDDPVRVLERYHGYLREGGLLIVSMYVCTPARWVWRKLDGRFETVASTRVTNELNRSWDVRLLRPR